MVSWITFLDHVVASVHAQRGTEQRGEIHQHFGGVLKVEISAFSVPSGSTPRPELEAVNQSQQAGDQFDAFGRSIIIKYCITFLSSNMFTVL